MPALAFRQPPDFAPDASYEYSNTDDVLLGLVAEKAGGRPLAQQFRERLFAPPGPAGTSLPAADDRSLPAPRPLPGPGYAREPGAPVGQLLDPERPAGRRTRHSRADRISVPAG
ncbi:serine hydrolase [Streptomyces sp. NPDC058646]|uniref:serine hydrolase n=1 Tax=Streptomyces sp. NPDC058646 TaxID=3346574 RepID=UPI00364C86A9